MSFKSPTAEKALEALTEYQTEAPRPRERTVQNGELRAVSATQITTFEACNRKWHFEKVKGLKVEQTEAMARGEQIHGQMERCLLQGLEPDHPSAKAAAQEYRRVLVSLYGDDVLGGLGHGWQVTVEEPRNFNLGIKAAGIPVKGRVDVRLPVISGRVPILDWKTCSSWRFIKTPEELAVNVQGVIYGKYALTLEPKAREFLFGHVYIRTKGGTGAKSVLTDPLDREHIDRRYEAIEETVARMREAARVESTADIEPNLNHCGAFGGCPYQNVCPRADSKSLLDLMREEESELPLHTLAERLTGDDMTLAEKLRARKASQTTTAAPEAGETTATVAINPPDAAPPEPVTTYSKSEPVTTPTEPVEPAWVSEGTDPLTLFIDCEPKSKDGLLVQDLGALIDKATPLILATLRKHAPKDVPEGATDVREVKFGQGTTGLCVYFKQNPPTGYVTASNRGLSAQVLEVLEPLATMVVRGVR